MLFEDTESSDQEPDFSQPNLTRLPEPARVNRIYTKEDLYPEGLHRKSAMCPLASYWPVYVNGFKVDSPDRSTWYDDVASFFAYYGLLTRMVYFDDSDAELLQFQTDYQVLDMLVYFTCKEDAVKAIDLCHRVNRYGYTINVACGRVSSKFIFGRTVMIDEIATDYSLQWRSYLYPLEFVAEKRFELFEVEFITRVSTTKFAIQFKYHKSLECAFRSQLIFVPFHNDILYQQRFVERDVIARIRCLIQRDSSFMDMMPKPHLLQDLMLGRKPTIGFGWRFLFFPKRSEKFMKCTKKYYRKYLAGKQPVSENVQTSTEKELPSDKLPDETEETKNQEELSSDKQPDETEETKNQEESKTIQRKREALELINKFLIQRGVPVTTFEYAEECLQKFNKLQSCESTLMKIPLLQDLCY